MLACAVHPTVSIWPDWRFFGRRETPRVAAEGVGGAAQRLFGIARSERSYARVHLA
jgi:hypothetical protein